MRKKINLLLVAAGIFGAPLMTLAHPGHGHGNPLSPGHYVSNPEHSVLLLLTVVTSIAFAWFINRKTNRVK